MLRMSTERANQPPLTEMLLKTFVGRAVSFCHHTQKKMGVTELTTGGFIESRKMAAKKLKIGWVGVLRGSFSSILTFPLSPRELSIVSLRPLWEQFPRSAFGFLSFSRRTCSNRWSPGASRFCRIQAVHHQQGYL
jgi:hypothetical protein